MTYNVEEKYQDQKNVFFTQMSKLLGHNKLSNELIKKAEVAADLPIGYHNIICPGSLQTIAGSFETWLDGKMLECLKLQEKPASIRKTIALALEIRILELVDKNALMNICNFSLLPQNIFTGALAACATCNAIWRYAGDSSTDFNYYTKRGLLIGVYTSAKAFYFKDTSENYQDTRAFIRNALDNIITIANFKKNIKLPKKEDIPIIRLFS